MDLIAYLEKLKIDFEMNEEEIKITDKLIEKIKDAKLQ